MDVSFPPERVAYIAEDAGLSLIVTSAKFAAANSSLPCSVVDLPTIEAELDAIPATRPMVPDDDDDLAYIIYTSGTTGRAERRRGQPFEHLPFPLRGRADLRRDAVRPGLPGDDDRLRLLDRGDLATFAAGATLVAGPTDSRKFGSGLADFLNDEKITVLYCVPTLLATLDRDVPSIRALMVGGEACPRDLVERWSARAAAC